MTIIFQGDPGAIELAKFLILNPFGVAIVVIVVFLSLIVGGLAAYATVTEGAFGF